MYQFRSHKGRLLTFLIGLLGCVLGAVFFAVNQANTVNARLHLGEALEITANTFLKSLEARQLVLTEIAKILSADFAFKSAYATRDKETITSVLENHQYRAGANMMILMSMEGSIIAHTLQNAIPIDSQALGALLKNAMQSRYGQATAVLLINNKAYQVVVVPLYAPDPVAWVLVGFNIDDAFVKEQREYTHSEVSLLYRRDADPWRLLASTLDAKSRDDIRQFAAEIIAHDDGVFDQTIAAREHLTRHLFIQQGNIGDTAAILQRPLDTVLAPYIRLRNMMLLLFAAGLIISIFGAMTIAKNISRPVEKLVSGVRRIETGDYSSGVTIKRRDEIGQLATSFNRMVKGLQERDRVRNLLGKVVAPQIAEELLSREIELGGEEREITILFSDIRDFTSISENRSPHEILSLLNRYLTRMTDVIEVHGGVVDQYIGDGIMALFGAPLALQNSSQNAVLSAMHMLRELQSFNAELGQENEQPIRIGIGINTSTVWVGNMGSHNRLNYTVIGDGVNLTSRIEGLTKRYHVAVIVSETVRDACVEIAFRELDWVRVKGRETPVAIYEPVGELNSLSEQERTRLEQHQCALNGFRHRDWELAENSFSDLADQSSNPQLYKFYLQRIESFRQHPPPMNWAGTTTFKDK